MTPENHKLQIVQAIQRFSDRNFPESAMSLFSALGYRSNRRFKDLEITPENITELFPSENTFRHDKALTEQWVGSHFLFQLTGEDILEISQGRLEFEGNTEYDDAIYQSYLFFAIELEGDQYTRTQLSIITREINKLFFIPVMVLFKHGDSLTQVVINRRPHKKDQQKDVLEKVTLIKDIKIDSPHRAHVEILFDLSLEEIQRRDTINNFLDLHNAWQAILDVSELNKRFFRELANWYFWAVNEVVFPNDAEEDEETRNATNVIRLITRLIFIWFIKEKGLVPDGLFDELRLQDLLNYDDSNDSTYYKAILQNLFFATLNQEMNTAEQPDSRTFRDRDSKSGGRDPNYLITNIFKYEDCFKDHEKALKIFENIPFLNGGLFECLDRIDGFSDRSDNPIRVPDYLFFDSGQEVDLNEAYGTRDKRYFVRGLIHILNRYKFTIEENTPIDEEVALDPELLGKVFENLLASYNPETGTTARKQTGSFYTPRPIVNYMVDETIIDYLMSRQLDTGHGSEKDDYENRLRHLIEYNDKPHQFDANEVESLIDSIDHIKVLDPAVGSGAFPMGILQKLVLILSKLDPGNEFWKEKQIEKVKEIPDMTVREAILGDIEDSFTGNELDYGRKLYLIENCIYGVDIQPIAVQIAKLRFFISLVVEQNLNDGKPNRGIRPLPNLETKFIAANSLVGITIPDQQITLLSQPIIEKKERLREIRRKYFTARTPQTKEEFRQEDEILRDEISALLNKLSNLPVDDTEMLSKWDPYDLCASAPFFDIEWMFGLSQGFDIVIGNPPYVSAVEHSKSDPVNRKKYRKLFPPLKGSYDLYTVFLLQGLNLTNQKGCYCWIVPNKFLVADYSQPTLKKLKENGLYASLDVSSYDVFDGTGVYPIIVVGSKSTGKEYAKYTISKLDDLMHGIIAPQKSNLFAEYSTFRDLNVKFRSGTTGYQAKAISEYISEKPKKGSIPFVVSGSIDKYSIDFDNVRFMKKTYRQAYISKGPEIAASKWGFWMNEKIVIAGMTKVIEAVYYSDPLALGVGAYAIYDFAEYSPYYLLGILNSKFISYYLNIKFKDKHLAGGYLAINKSTLESLPLVVANPKEQQYLIELVRGIMDPTKSQGEIKSSHELINKYVYKLYDLSEEMVALMDQ